jgi:type VI secretion system protein VasJ
VAIPENIIDLASQPIEGDNPGGKDSRLGQNFLGLQGELDRLNSMSGITGGVNWQKAQDLSLAILKDESKDILVAVYFAVSLLELNGPVAIGPAAEFLATLISSFWSQLFPPLKRIRARINALDWWKEKNIQFIKKYTEPPVSLEILESAKNGYTKLDAALRALTEKDVPIVLDLIKNLASIPVEEVKTPPPPPVVETINNEARTSEVPKADEGPTASTASVAKEQVSASKVVTPPKSEEVILPPPPPQLALPGEGPDSDGAKLSMDVLVKSINSYLSYNAEDYSSPWYFKLQRIRDWFKIKVSPPVGDNGKTLLHDPPSEIISSLNRLLSEAKYQDLIKTSENQSSVYLFWLDLHYFTYKGLLGIGNKVAALALKDEVLNFSRAFPEILDLSFEDGTSFASMDTKAWLSEGATGKSGGDSLDYNALLGEEGTKAFQELSKPQWKPSSGRDFIKMKTLEIRLWKKMGKLMNASALSDYLISEVERLSLISYDPKVAIEALKASYETLRLIKPINKEKINKILYLLSQGDPLAALKLSPLDED